MRTVVCLKQVLDPATVRVSSRGELDTREAVRTIDAASLSALEEALRLKEASGGMVIALSMGGAEVEDSLFEAMAMGADRAILLSDLAFIGGDAHAVSYVLARAISVLAAEEAVDLVLAGAASSDDGGGQVGPQIAELLGWPSITFAIGLNVADGRASAIQAGDVTIRHSVPLPAVVTVPAGANQPRLPLAANIMNVFTKHTVQTWSATDIGADPALLGAAGSLTEIRRTQAPPLHARGDVLEGSVWEAAEALAAHLRARGFI